MTGRQAPLLSVRDLKVVFPTPIGMVHAVDGVSFDLEAGQSMGIVGESGSGKTVTAKTLMNLLPSYALVDGSVNFDGRDLRHIGDVGASRPSPLIDLVVGPVGPVPDATRTAQWPPDV